MSFLHLKNKTEPQYHESKTPSIEEGVFDIKSKLEKNTVHDSKNRIPSSHYTILQYT